MSGPRPQIREEPRAKSRHKFRQLAHESCGEGFDIPDGHRVLFTQVADSSSPFPKVTATLTFKTADTSNSSGSSTTNSGFSSSSKTSNTQNLSNPSQSSTSDNDQNAHEISFVFVDPKYQNDGQGTRLVKNAIGKMKSCSNVPIHVESSWKSVRFFEKLGFVRTSEAYDIVCGGSQLFRTLVKMEYR